MSEHTALLARYKHLRQVALPLNTRPVETLSRDVMDEGGKRLGILKNNVLVLDTEDEIAVLMDYCIYDVRRQGANAIERFLAESPPAPDSDEMVLLQAMRQARYSLFAVEAVEPGVGVHVRDLLRDEPLFLMDVALSKSASPGMVLASRVMAPEGIGMTTRAALPVAWLPPAEATTILRAMAAKLKTADLSRLSPEQASELAGDLIRTCLQQGAAEHIGYLEPGRRGGRGRAVQAPAGGGPRRTQSALPPAGVGRSSSTAAGVGGKGDSPHLYPTRIGLAYPHRTTGIQG